MILEIDMGYIIRLGKIAKEHRDQFRGKSESEVAAMLGVHHTWYSPPHHQELYEIGKHVSYVDETYERYYDFKDDENEFYIISKEALVKIIKAYQKDVAEFFEYMHQGKYPFESPEQYFKSKALEWGHREFKMIKLGPSNDGEMTGSWSKEYAIFNLLFILKTFNFEKDHLIYSGW